MFVIVRLLLFFLAGSLGAINLYSVGRIFDNYYITEDGFLKMENVPTFFYLIEFVVYFMRTLFCFLVLIRLIQVPTKAPNKEQQDIDDGYIWCTALAILMLSLGTNTDHDIGFETYLGSNSDTPHHHGFNLASRGAHTIARVISVVAKLICITWGITQVIINTAKPGTFKFNRGYIPWHRWLMGLMDCSVFMVGNAYIIYNVYQMHPSSLKMKDSKVGEFLSTWNIEFYLFQLTEFALGSIGVAITFYSYFMYDAKASDKTIIAFSHGYRVLILGLYTSSSATWHAHSMEIYKNGKPDNVTLFAASPFVYFLIVSIITTVYKFTTNEVVRNLKDAANLIALTGVRLFHLSGSVLFWRLGHALCIFAMIHMLLLGFSEWVHVEVTPGTVVVNIKGVVGTVENDIVHAGEKAFDVLKELDPCRWSIHDNDVNTQLNEDINYSYSFPGPDNSTAKTKTFNMKNVNPIEKINCKCTGGTSTCDCDTINAVKRNLTWSRTLKESFINSNDIAQIDGISSLEEFTEDKTYAEKLQRCHSIECDVVLGTAIAAETALLGSDFLWIFGPAESVVADAAWFAQQANRIGHNVIKYGMKLAKTVTGLVKRVSQMKPMIETFKFLAGLDTVVHFSPDIGQIFLALPVVLLGLFSIAASLAKRENVNTVVTELALVTKTYIPLMLVSWSMTGLVFAIPPLVERIIKAIPKAIIQSKIKETYSLTLLRYVFIISAVGATFIMLSSALASFSKLRQSGNRFLKLMREPANKFFGRGSTRGSAEVNADGDQKISFLGRVRATLTLADSAWMQAFLISAVVFVIMGYAIINNYYLLGFHYGPTNRFISTLGSLRAHATLHGHSSEVAEVSREGLCGLIGKGVEAAIKESVKEMEQIFGELEGSLETLIGSIDEFLGLATLFDNFGKISMEIFDSSWLVIEFVIAFALPTLNAIIMLYVAFAKSYYDRKIKYDDAEFIASFSKGIIEVLIYYNIILLVMVHQAYNMLGNVDFKLFFIEMKTGPLFPSCAVCLLVNALSLMSLYVERTYPTKK